MPTTTLSPSPTAATAAPTTPALAGKVALVSGGSQGIGAAIARALARAGAAVALTYATGKTRSEQVVASITATGGRAVAVPADLAQPGAPAAAVAAARAAFGQLDILVNNAGVYGFAPLEQVTLEEIRRHFDLNVSGLLLLTKEAVPHLRPGASIINIGSVVSRTTPPGSVVYTATKGAVDALTGVLSRELGPRGIRVNAINPGMVETEGTHQAGVIGSDFQTQVVAQTPLGRIGQPQDIADVAVFLASDAARWITGEQLLVGGGLR